MRHNLIFIAIICLLSLASACRQSSREGKTGAPPEKEVKDFRNKLDSLNSIEDIGPRSAAIRALYDGAEPRLQNAFCGDMLLATRDILLYNCSADPGLLPFHRRLALDDALNDKNRAAINLRLAFYHAFIMGETDSAASYLQYVYNSRNVLGDTLEAKLYACAAQIFQLRGQLKEASENMYRSLRLYEKMHDSDGFANTSNNLANVYRAMNDYEKAIRIRKSILPDFERSKNRTGEAITMQGLACDYASTDRIDSARIYFARAEKLFDGGVQQPVAQYYLYLSKAGVYITLKKLDSSRLYFDKAKTLLPLLNDEMQNIIFTMTSSIAYSNVRDVREEAKMIEDAIPLLAANNNLQLVRDAYFSLYNISLKQHIGQSSIEYHQRYDSMKALLADQANREYVAEMESKYESQKKNFKIQVQQKELQRRKTLNAILILSVILIAAGGGLIIARLKLQRSRREAKLQNQFTQNLLRNTEEERRRIAGELHDGVSHELLTLKNNMMQRAIASESKIGAIYELRPPGESPDIVGDELLALNNSLQQTAAASESKIDTIIRDIRMLSRNLHPVMLDQIGLEHSVRHLCEQLVRTGQLFVATTIDYHGQLSKYEELQVYRIIQESLSNTIKYAAAIAAQVLIETKDDHLAVTIMDNGKGFDVSEKLQSESVFGLNSMVQRSKALNATIQINSSGQGTTINLEIPLQHAEHHRS